MMPKKEREMLAQLIDDINMNDKLIAMDKITCYNVIIHTATVYRNALVDAALKSQEKTE